MSNSAAQAAEEQLVSVPAGLVTLDGNLTIPQDARAVVLFAHGSGSSRHSPRNRYVARMLNEARLATLLIDLLTLHGCTKKYLTRVRHAYGSTSTCSPNGSSTQPIGLPNSPIPGIFRSAISVPAPEPPPRSRQRRSAPIR
jgi:hypothetical protein